MSGKSEVDKPFLVEGLCHVFKDFDAAGVVFDEGVVGGEDSGDFALSLFSMSVRLVFIVSVINSLSEMEIVPQRQICHLFQVNGR